VEQTSRVLYDVETARLLRRVIPLIFRNLGRTLQPTLAAGVAWNTFGAYCSQAIFHILSLIPRSARVEESHGRCEALQQGLLERNLRECRWSQQLKVHRDEAAMGNNLKLPQLRGRCTNPSVPLEDPAEETVLKVLCELAVTPLGLATVDFPLYLVRLHCNP
jgi:hypothetical protein